MTLINCNHGPEVASLRRGRNDQGWINHWPIFFPSIIHICGNHPYSDIAPLLVFYICILRSGYICIPSYVRHFLVWVMLVSIVGSIYIPDTSSVMSGLLYFEPRFLGSLTFLTSLWNGEVYTSDTYPLFIGIEDLLPTDKYGLGLEELNPPLHRHHCCPTCYQAMMAPADVAISMFVTSLWRK